ncbi:hypothetical protein PUN28_006594 [Cardiocondyla obscurior]|uniref:Uncharacterized protein n=1 Tax=Cardiocondyla obscurior TaxID=286306 RepID=A0AAW2G9E9_9HYME
MCFLAENFNIFWRHCMQISNRKIESRIRRSRSRGWGISSDSKFVLKTNNSLKINTEEKLNYVNMDIDSTRFLHKIRMLRAYILQILSEMAKVAEDKNVLPRACKDPQKFQRVCKKKKKSYLFLYYTSHYRTHASHALFTLLR